MVTVCAEKGRNVALAAHEDRITGLRQPHDFIARTDLIILGNAAPLSLNPPQSSSLRTTQVLDLSEQNSPAPA